jgi:hypothetical protein
MRSLRGAVRDVVLRAQHIDRRDRLRLGLISGCPRSGTSALSYWIGRQKGAASFYESRVTAAALAFLQQVRRFRNLSQNEDQLKRLLRRLVIDYYASQKIVQGRLIIEKEPLEPIFLPGCNYVDYIDCMRELFPDLRLLFIERNVYDTVYSMTRRSWGGSLTAAPVIERSIEEATAIWLDCHGVIAKYSGIQGVMVCSYEELMAEPQRISRRICDFFGLTCVSPFVPRPSKGAQWSEPERALIADLARTSVNA